MIKDKSFVRTALINEVRENPENVPSLAQKLGIYGIREILRSYVDTDDLKGMEL